MNRKAPPKGASPTTARQGIIVTGVGGGVGQSILKAFQGSAYRVIAVDAEPLAVGLHTAECAYIGAYAADAQFVPRLLEIAHAEDAKLVFPGHDVELLPLARARQAFLAAGVIPVVSPPNVIELCDDKLSTARYVVESGYSAPRTYAFGDFPGLVGPVVLKPQRGGARSKDTYYAETAAEFQRYGALVDHDNCVVQECIVGEEYTCGSVTLDGRCHGVITMRRSLRAGDTYKAFVESHPVVAALVRNLAERLGVFGALNVQLKLSDGVPYVFELNARCSGTTAARARSGFNEPVAIADFILRGRVPQLTVQRTAILRYWNELVVSEADIAALSTDKFVSRMARDL